MVAVPPAGMVIAKSWRVAAGRGDAGLRVEVVWASAARPSPSARLVVWVTAVPVAVRPRAACRPAVQQRTPVCRAVQFPGVRAEPVLRRRLAVVPMVGLVVRVVPVAVPVGPVGVRRSAWEAVAVWVVAVASLPTVAARSLRPGETVATSRSVSRECRRWVWWVVDRVNSHRSTIPCSLLLEAPNLQRAERVCHSRPA